MHCIIYGKRFADCKVCRTWALRLPTLPSLKRGVVSSSSAHSSPLSGYNFVYPRKKKKNWKKKRGKSVKILSRFHRSRSPFLLCFSNMKFNFPTVISQESSKLDLLFAVWIFFFFFFPLSVGLWFLHPAVKPLCYQICPRGDSPSHNWRVCCN